MQDAGPDLTGTRVASVYMDHNATSPVRPEIREAMAPYVDPGLGNASSLHRCGRSARAGIERARDCVAQALGCSPAEVFFTSGGTEACNWALKGVLLTAHRQHRRIVTTAIEHYAVLRVCTYLEAHGVEVVRVPADSSGCVDPDAVASAVNERTTLISVMHANNETGCLQPIAAIGELAWRRGVPLHVDAVQTFGKEPVHVEDLNADLLSISAHKANGPKGVGALYVRRGMIVDPLLHGGGQESGMRAGTENVAAIVGFGRAAALMRAGGHGWPEPLRLLRDRLESGICSRIPDVQVNGRSQARLANTVNLSFTGVSSEVLVRALDEHGIAVSSGSACAAGESEPSHVLLGMGLDRARAQSAVRFSLGWGSTQADVTRVLEVLPGLVHRLRERTR